MAEKWLVSLEAQLKLSPIFSMVENVTHAEIGQPSMMSSKMDFFNYIFQLIAYLSAS